jgi:hypothetical protein
MKSTFKIIIVSVLLIAIITSIELYLFLIFSKQPSSGRWITIKGQIIPSENVSKGDVKPLYIEAFYPNYDYICRDNRINIAEENITWKNETNGFYSVSFWIPITMDVVLTTRCDSCNHKTVSINESTDSFEADLLWDKKICSDEFYMPNDYKEEISHSREIFNAMDTLQTTKPFNVSEKDSIKADIRDGRDSISDSERTTGNESILNAHYAYWYAWRAEYKMSLYDLKYCVDDIKNLLNSYNASSCYAPNYEAYTTFLSSNYSYESWKNDYTLTKRPNGESDLEKMKNDIISVHNTYSLISQENYECQNAFMVLNKSFDFQSNYCKVRDASIYLFNAIWLIVAFAIGIILGQRWKHE